jgi:radical SAM protein with 4Fe4S-binding SPASM domain
LSESREKLIKRAADIGTKFFTITGGEPFTRPDIWEIFECIKESGISLSVATNGLLLDDQKIKKLKRIGVDRVQISLEGPTKELNDLIRGEGVFQRLTENIIPSLVKEGIFTAISMTPTNRNWEALEEMVSLCKDLGVDSLSIRRFVPQGRASGSREICDMKKREYKEFLEKLYRLKIENKDTLKIASGDPLSILVDPRIEDLAGREDLLGGCTAGITSLAISATGDIKACTRMGKILGNVREDDLKEIWDKHPFLERLRERKLMGAKCRSCEYKFICGGCRASALEYNGGAFQDDPNCWIGTTI